MEEKVGGEIVGEDEDDGRGEIDGRHREGMGSKKDGYVLEWREWVDKLSLKGNSSLRIICWLIITLLLSGFRHK